MQFKVGDFVEAIGSVAKGFRGVIIGGPYSKELEFLVKFEGFNGHDGGGISTTDDCWYVWPYQIRLDRKTVLKHYFNL